jgi:hypothetical protein
MVIFVMQDLPLRQVAQNAPEITIVKLELRSLVMMDTTPQQQVLEVQASV